MNVVGASDTLQAVPLSHGLFASDNYGVGIADDTVTIILRQALLIPIEISL